MSNIFIISGPSGSGQDSVINELRKKMEIKKMVTMTTREMRPEDQDGVTYHFISKEKFQEMIGRNEFFEYALEDNGNYYGLPISELEKAKKSQSPIIWKIDYKGVLAAKKILSEAKSIFIHIPKELIRSRLEKRGESEEIISRRLEYADGWYENEKVFDYKVENEEGKLNATVEKVAEIIENNIS